MRTCREPLIRIANRINLPYGERKQVGRPLSWPGKKESIFLAKRPTLRSESIRGNDTLVTSRMALLESDRGTTLSVGGSPIQPDIYSDQRAGYSIRPEIKLSIIWFDFHLTEFLKKSILFLAGNTIQKGDDRYDD